VNREIERRRSMHTEAQKRHARQREQGDAALQLRAKERDPDPLEPPYEDPDDPDAVPGEDDEFALPGEDDEYASPATEPHEEPLVTP
jgi:hypothetical protein